MGYPIIAALVIVFLYFINCIKILREYERGVIFSLGRLQQDAKGPGLIFVFAPVQKMVRIDLRQQAVLHHREIVRIVVDAAKPLAAFLDRVLRKVLPKAAAHRRRSGIVEGSAEAGGARHDGR